MVRLAEIVGAVAVCAWAFAPASAWAHPFDVGTLEVHVENTSLTADFDIGALPVAELMHLRSEQLSPEGISTAARAILDATLASGPLQADGQTCTWDGLSRAELGLNARIRLHATARCPRVPGELRWKLPFLARLPISFRVQGRALVNGEASEFLATPAMTTVVLQERSQSHLSVAECLSLGLSYLGIWPGEHAPVGVAHLLCLLALLWCLPRRGESARTLIAFGAGQLLMLGACSLLPDLGSGTFPERWMLTMLALSIAYVAAEDWIDSSASGRWIVAGICGLLHGQAWASELLSLRTSSPGSSRATLMLGLLLAGALVEGLLAVMVLSWLDWARQRARFVRFGMPWGAVGLALASIGWWWRMN
jgi:hypothetical protein